MPAPSGRPSPDTSPEPVPHLSAVPDGAPAAPGLRAARDAPRNGGARRPQNALRGGSDARRRRESGTAGSRRRASLSTEAIVATAITMLDRDGAAALTLRALATELGSGAASLYWHAAGKDELMAMVADEVLGRALAEFQVLRTAGLSEPRAFEPFPAPRPAERTSTSTAQALVELRCLALCLFSQMLAHRWLAVQLVAAGPNEENALRTWECAGQILQRMELSSTQCFHASLATVNYATGMGVEISQRQDAREAEDATQLFLEQLDRWDRASTRSFPFVHCVLGEFQHHDDRSGYVAGLDLLLSGIERQTWQSGARS